MSHPVSISQLRFLCNYLVNSDFPYFLELKEAYRLLLFTGCRVSEIFEIDRWSIVSSNYVSLKPQKFNNHRFFLLDNSFSYFLESIQNQTKPFLGRTYSQLQYLTNKINPYAPILSGNKTVTLYIFRYLYVRELSLLGHSPVYIANQMGYTSPTAVSNYLNANLTSRYLIPSAA